MKTKTITIIVPVYNEEANIGPLMDRLEAVLSSLEQRFCLLFVDDGSTDGTWAAIRRAGGRSLSVDGLALSRNFGHQAAITAGLDAAEGDAVIMMDGDLQHPPELIPRMVEYWEKGYEAVLTVRKENRGTGLKKRWASALFYKILNRFSKVPVRDGTADFRLLSRRLVSRLRELPERGRFYRGLVPWMGFPTVSIPYTASPRAAGRSKYSWPKMFQLAREGIFSFTTAPLYLCSAAGLAMAGFSAVYGVYALWVKWFTTQGRPGWTSILVSVLFIGGIQLIMLGVIGEYIARIFEEVKHRPVYLVRDRIVAHENKIPNHHPVR